MPIKTFRITNAGPFDDITFEFDEHVNVFVGPNNSGKSTALLALAGDGVFSFEFPRKLLHGPISGRANGKLTLFESQISLTANRRNLLDSSFSVPPFPRESRSPC